MVEEQKINFEREWEPAEGPIIPVEENRSDRLFERFTAGSLQIAGEIVPLGYKTQTLKDQMDAEGELVERLKEEGRKGVIHLNESGLPLPLEPKKEEE